MLSYANQLHLIFSRYFYADLSMQMPFGLPLSFLEIPKLWKLHQQKMPLTCTKNCPLTCNKQPGNHVAAVGSYFPLVKIIRKTFISLLALVFIVSLSQTPQFLVL